jgi:hypothetical protein
MKKDQKIENKVIKNNDNVVSEFVDRREFTYTNKECSLSFKLRTDRSDELRHFKAILLQALEEIDKILAPMKN